ncbi:MULTISPECIES: helix-turn-helix transcriptional regulator [unclassified Enterococcus]|uniref:helix-turn-helix domain-containing protein n=1 Tax=unclassified Enterococcus TaxID=2608891 RepID=UPI0015574259|nr:MULTISPECIES: helix-turn-helix transcriptional regulator [unclassified Enterococcus]MBS7576014.1 helix-turn-helix transcriptional regulator [Enterococcus sp. MMGLQ5-2]MBS7583247.1 helix-turn-helix transcriptional regulator [Enterococcus sp. MMGLQ5-1]NPD11107.1 helix-turn-helix transcriptional regulator [Enterococcus sp. MMGLQ5-1]NPD35850.1 helix-turn-helix transcriptional regulator [Enterococcus sp. MMGLQ5-2]
MNTFEIIKALAQKRGKNVKEVALELGFGENLFYKWKNQSPTADKLEAVANYFNVSTDYLLNREKEISVEDLEKYRLIAANGKPISDKTRRIIVSILKEMEENDE